MKRLSLIAVLAASPAFAADAPFFSLRNTDFVVTLGFLLFVGILVYYKVPALIGKLLDKRAETIRRDLDEARKLREEAQDLFASYQRRQREVKDQADEIVANAKREAKAQAEKAKLDLAASIERRLKAAEEQIASAESDAVRAVRNSAIQTAIAATTEILAKQMGPDQRAVGLDASIEELGKRLN